MKMMIFGWKKAMINFIRVVILIICYPVLSISQDEIYRYFQLDSIVIVASKNDLDIKSFVQYMIDDKSFYKAFKNLRTANYSFTNDVSINKNDKKLASYTSKASQDYTKPCRSMKEWDKKIIGDVIDKKGEYNYLTMKLYDRLFFTHGLHCETINQTSSVKSTKSEKYISELKTLMFDPGSETHIPLMGAKTNIFDTDMAKYYKYNLSSTQLNGIDCYLFDIEVKKEYQDHKENKTVVKRIMTWFEKENKQIAKREYDLRSRTIAYSFDVHMDVDIGFKNNVYYPSEINYNGTWKILGKNRESAKFKLTVTQFK